ncbi:MAG: hypothetical protein C0434_05150 [Xanthomonadaceae bacterium]|nr:hypothetical protein [Xanthomonadaceae bacterium]
MRSTDLSAERRQFLKTAGTSILVGGLTPPAAFAADAAAWVATSSGTLAGIDLEYDEWAVMQWVWKAKHNADDFLGLKGAQGRTTTCRGITFHCYRNRKIVRETTQWNFREVGVQLGALEPPVLFWKK